MSTIRLLEVCAGAENPPSVGVGLLQGCLEPAGDRWTRLEAASRNGNAPQVLTFEVVGVPWLTSSPCPHRLPGVRFPSDNWDVCRLWGEGSVMAIHGYNA